MYFFTSTHHLEPSPDPLRKLFPCDPLTMSVTHRSNSKICPERGAVSIQLGKKKTEQSMEKQLTADGQVRENA